MPGRRRFHSFDFRTTSQYVHDLLVKELGAELIPDSDKTVPQKWALPKLTQKEEDDMGLFDELAEAGIDLGGVELTPFEYKDGVYEMAFGGAEILPPPDNQPTWDMQMELTYKFLANADGTETKYKNKVFIERLRMPKASALKSDDEDIKKRAEGSLTRLFQRLYQLGIENPAKADVSDVNEFRGNRYLVPLNTPEANDKFPNPRQMVGMVKAKKSSDEKVKSLFENRD